MKAQRDNVEDRRQEPANSVTIGCWDRRKSSAPNKSPFRGSNSNFWFSCEPFSSVPLWFSVVQVCLYCPCLIGGPFVRTCSSAILLSGALSCLQFLPELLLLLCCSTRAGGFTNLGITPPPLPWPARQLCSLGAVCFGSLPLDPLLGARLHQALLFLAQRIVCHKL